MVFQFDFAKTDTRVGGAFLEEGQMKLAISVVVAVVVPFGFVVLAGVMLRKMLAKRGQDRWPNRLRVTTQSDRLTNTHGSFAASPSP